jgi:phosphate uptake regulator
MKRKVIQIAESTQLVSLPRKWCIENNIKKGDELDLEVDNKKITISYEHAPVLQRIEIESEALGKFLTRYIHGLYMRGIDEIKVNIKSSKDLERIQQTLSKDVGFEVVEQGSSYCVIKNISGDIESFDQLLRRIFILMLNMTDEGLNFIKDNKLKELANLLTLEEANNRFTISCRRYLNRKGHPTLKVGPLYFVVEELEKLADEYKYFYSHLVQAGMSSSARGPVIALLTKINAALRNLVECFYKFDSEKLVEIHAIKQAVYQKWQELIKSKKTPSEQLIIAHHLLIISEKIADFTGLLVAMQADTAV